jgi:serine/threonine protein phosphatase 1
MIYAIGDIHGELLKLAGLLDKIQSNGLGPEDRLVFLGDYVDRGPETPGVLDLMIQIRTQRPGTVFLRGNHDQAMLQAREVFDPRRTSALTKKDIVWWLDYGGRETIDSYKGGEGAWYDKVPPNHWAFLESTQFEHREGPYIFVHAGLVPPGKTWTETDDPRLWIREDFIGSKADFGGIVVFGHTPQDLFLPIVMANKIGIDTGAAYGGPLTSVVLDPHKPFDPEIVKFIHS